MIVLDEDVCMVDIAKYFINFTQEESCGKCSPCRIGLRRLYNILERITSGQGEEGDLDLLEEVAWTVKEGSLCGLGQTAPNPVLSTIRYFKDEYISHIVDKRCPAKVCKELIEYSIDADRCTGCLLCQRNCPVNAITEHKLEHEDIADGGDQDKVDSTGNEKRKKPLSICVIDPDVCIKCGICFANCPQDAIFKGDKLFNEEQYTVVNF